MLTAGIDVAQLVLYAFWLFFIGLVYYLVRENKREGYPLEADTSKGKFGVFFPPIPKPKTYLLPHGGVAHKPRLPGEDKEPPLKAVRAEAWEGAPYVPTGDPLRDGVGPASWAYRADEPDRTANGGLKIVPLRNANDFYIAEQDTDPRGLLVVDADGVEVGKVKDAWIDRGEIMIRYLEVETDDEAGGGRAVLLPINFAKLPYSLRLTPFMNSGKVKVASLLKKHFAHVPGTASPDRVTLLEEDKIMGYFAGGHLYAKPERAEPLL